MLKKTGFWGNFQGGGEPGHKKHVTRKREEGKKKVNAEGETWNFFQRPGGGNGCKAVGNLKEWAEKREKKNCRRKKKDLHGKKRKHERIFERKSSLVGNGETLRLKEGKGTLNSWKGGRKKDKKNRIYAGGSFQSQQEKYSRTTLKKGERGGDG